MRVFFCVILLIATCFAQDYWTPRRKVETIGVTALHLGDAGQTCYHMITDSTWREHGIGSPRTCQWNAVYLIGLGPVVQWMSYQIVRHHPTSKFWKRVDTGIPSFEITLSANAIRCSNTGGCNKFGF